MTVSPDVDVRLNFKSGLHGIINSSLDSVESNQRSDATLVLMLEREEQKGLLTAAAHAI
jgi:hypothetical protein